MCSAVTIAHLRADEAMAPYRKMIVVPTALRAWTFCPSANISQSVGYKAWDLMKLKQ